MQGATYPNIEAVKDAVRLWAISLKREFRVVKSYFAAVEHRALEVLRPRPPGEAISIHHDWCDRYVMKYYCLSLMHSSVFLCFDNFVFLQVT